MPRARATGDPVLLPQIRRDDPTRGCRIDMVGPDAETMIQRAKEIASEFLHEPLSNLYLSDSSTALPAGWRRFVPNLSVDNPPISWKMNCTIRLAPEIVDERRELRRERSKKVDDRPDEDDDEMTV